MRTYLASGGHFPITVTIFLRLFADFMAFIQPTLLHPHVTDIAGLLCFLFLYSPVLSSIIIMKTLWAIMVNLRFIGPYYMLIS